MFLDTARGFRDPARVEERREMLATEPAVQPLNAYRSQLVARRTSRTGMPTYVPDFDPADAATPTQVLFVLEAPGPMTNPSSPRAGSGFISADNNDQTAANTWEARHAAGLDHGCLAWNIVPWHLGVASQKPTAADLTEGALELAQLIALLPDLRVVILHGAFAQRGWLTHTAKAVDRPLHVAGTWHPSPLSLNTPARRADFAATLGWAKRIAGGEPSDD